MFKKNFKNTFFLLFSSVFLAVSNWAVLSLITKKSSLLVLGSFTLAIAISNPIYQFLNLQLRPVYVTDREHEFSFNTYFTLRFFCLLLALVLGLGSSFFLSGLDNSFEILFSVFFLYGLDGLIEILGAKFHYEENFSIIAISTVFRGLSNFLGIFLGLIIFENLFSGIILSSLFKFLSLFFYDLRLFKSMFLLPKLNINFFLLYRLFLKVAPLGVSLLFVSLNINMSKYFIEYSYGKEMQGVFSTLSYLIVAGNMVVATLGQLLMPKISTFFLLKKKTKVLNAYLIFILISFLVGLLLYIFSCYFSYEFLEIFFSEKIAEHHYFLPYVMIYALFVYLVSANGYSLTSLGVLKSQTYLSIVVFIFNIGLNFIFLETASIVQIICFAASSFALQFLLGNIIFIRRWIKL